MKCLGVWEAFKESQRWIWEVELFFTVQWEQIALSIHLVLVGESRHSHWTNQLSFSGDLYVTLLGPSRVQPPVRGRGGTLTSWAAHLHHLLETAGDRGMWVAKWERQANIEPLPPPLFGSGREMSSLPGIKLPIKKIIIIKIKTLLKFVLNPNIWGNFFNNIKCSHSRTYVFSSNLFYCLQ